MADGDEAILHPPQGGGDRLDRRPAQRGLRLNYGRDEMTSGGAREHRVDVLEQNLRNMGLDPDDFTFYTDGFRYGAPPHAGWGLGVARLLMVLTGAGNVREVVLFPRDRSRVTP